MSKETTKKFVENNGFICNKCGKVVVDGHKHKNEEDLCDQCKISDLEAKLAESEFRYENLHNLYYKDTEELKQQLAEKEEQLAEYSDINNALNSGLKDKCISCEEEHNQDKISFAVEQIMQIREKIDDSEKIYMGLTLDGIYDLDNIFDNKIAELTHQHEDKGE